MSSTFWQQWHRGYDDPDSALSRRLAVVQDQLRSALRESVPADGRRLRLISVCAGDGRDAIEVLAQTGAPVDALLVELDPVLAARASRRAADLGVDGVTVRTADAGLPEVYADHLPADVVLLCGVLGNVDGDATRTIIRRLPSMVRPGATVIWTRGHHRVPGDDPDIQPDPSDTVREELAAAGYQELAFVRSDDDGFRVGRHRTPLRPPETTELGSADRLFRFARHDDAPRPPRLIVITGRPGTGKTTLSRTLARQLRACYLRIDAVETALQVAASTFGIGAHAPAPIADVGPAGYVIAHRIAGSNLELGNDVVVDAVCPVPESRQAWRDTADAAAATLIIFETALTDVAEHRRRVTERTADMPDQQVPSWDDVVGGTWVPWDVHRDGDRTVIDTADAAAAARRAGAVIDRLG